MKFVGREKEQKIINYALDNQGYHGCIIYGRRRLGKTALVKHCIEGRNCRKLYYQCSESSEESNARSLGYLINKEYNLSSVSFSSFIDALEFIFKSSCKEETILVIDEYPYIRELIKGCDSRIQRLIDEYQADCHLKFFLLGSSISTMEELFSYSCPLFQRFQSSLLLKQMDYYDSSKFYETFSEPDKVKLYAVFGGIPFYNTQINSDMSVKDNIIRILSSHYSGLKDFVEIYLKTELRKINNANTIFETIALGAYHYKDILDKSHINSSSLLTSVLEKLVKMDLIERISPINETTNKQKSGYIISDATVKFYYNFIYRHASAQEYLDDDIFYDTYIKEELEHAYAPLTFETITKEYLIRNNGKNLVPLFTEIGKYWYDNPKEHINGEFDVVAKCQDGYIFFECKYKDSKINDYMIEEEIDQVNKTTLKVYQYGFVSKTGFDLKKDYPYIFFTLKDMYK